MPVDLYFEKKFSPIALFSTVLTSETPNIKNGYSEIFQKTERHNLFF